MFSEGKMMKASSKVKKLITMAVIAGACMSVGVSSSAMAAPPTAQVITIKAPNTAKACKWIVIPPVYPWYMCINFFPGSSYTTPAGCKSTYKYVC
jgi:hypothetical protein